MADKKFIPSIAEFVGTVFGQLTVVSKAPTGLNRWECRCICGQTVTLIAAKLRNGNNKSCGCRKRSLLGESTRTHGRANSRVTGYADRTYGIWQAMRARCTHASRADWHRYGGAGITVSASWGSFEQFLLDMGEAPAGKTLDRIDNAQGYYAGNCRWATPKEQALNSARASVFVIDGKADSISGWARTWKMGRTKAKRLLTQYQDAG